MTVGSLLTTKRCSAGEKVQWRPESCSDIEKVVVTVTCTKKSFLLLPINVLVTRTGLHYRRFYETKEVLERLATLHKLVNCFRDCRLDKYSRWDAVNNVPLCKVIWSAKVPNCRKDIFHIVNVLRCLAFCENVDDLNEYPVGGVELDTPLATSLDVAAYPSGLW